MSAKPLAQTASRTEGAASCAVNSFVRGTLVLLADGTRAAIETIRLGDTVLATDPETGETSAQPVVATIKGTGEKELVTVTVTDEDGSSGSVIATTGHPIWTKGGWADAGELQPGQWLRTSSGTWVLVAAVEHDRREKTVYNLTVQIAHTYHVYAGDASILTHNCAISSTGSAGDDWTRVGRWMSPRERQGMIDTGNIQWNFDGVHRVSNPPSANTYRAHPRSDVYMEYEVPASSLRPHSTGTSIIYGPESLQAQLPGRAQTGNVPFRNLIDRR